ncbi:hypothetical protein TNCV_1798301 [Trichonephila clavipes]|uniref:Uncharacterized protein n=1 Tax=Trichonephila clavipes TaxID=2585209 RepID=A0A8X6SSZ2_TRICX|nr:hypothetical protein TNCV_1798301 [Trichonephila clavipes]
MAFGQMEGNRVISGDVARRLFVPCRVGPRQWDQLKYEDSVSRRHVTDRLRVKTLSRDYLPALLVQRRTDVPLVTIHVVTSRTRISVTAVKRYRYTMHVSVQDVQSC